MPVSTLVSQAAGAAMHVFLMCYRLKVAGIYAEANTTKVIKFKTVGDRTVAFNVSEAMRKVVLPADPHDAVALVLHSVHPQPTS